ncbi:gcd1p [Saccharomyces arboricola H-6]|uniref:Translation initiation factor eIF2B subunit gamma n=1 Tax=Saccharomyces arboricola (strain H-6 / AS 2.3317 / CBS 10644) TaxID=1160507 RepID=J8PYV4_SACAR|nr:gcd1p [Saccharomyces arboricola H-6]
MSIQAFIFCGKGSGLAPFTQPDFPFQTQNKDSTTGTNGDKLNGLVNSTPDSSVISEFIQHSTRLPKALLPIGNRPMIEYVLDWCDQADFNEINVVAPVDEIELIESGLAPFLSLRKQQFELIYKALSNSNHSHHLQDPKKINFIPSLTDSTGESLQKELLPRINGDFVLLPCDFITDIPPQILVDQFRNRDDNNLAMTIYYKNSLDSSIDKKQQQKQKQQQFFTVYSENEESERQPILLDVYSQTDVTKTKYLQIRSHLLWNYPNLTISTKLLNSFIYFCSFEICQLLKLGSQSMSRQASFKDPFTGNQQQHTPTTTDDDEDRNHDDDDGDDNYKHSIASIQPTYFKKKNNLILDPINCNKSLSKVFRDLSRRSWQHSKPREPIGIFILPDQTSFIRANNLNAYMDANRFVLKIKSQTMFTKNIQIQSAAIGADAIVDPKCHISAHSNVKMSVVGTQANIGSRCRIAGSLLFPGVQLGDEVILENCIIGPMAKISSKCKLTNCYIEGHYIVEPRNSLKGETLANVYLDDDEDEELVYDDNVIAGSGEETDSNERSDEDSDDGDYTDEYEYEDDGLFER